MPERDAAPDLKADDAPCSPLQGVTEDRREEGRDHRHLGKRWVKAHLRGAPRHHTVALTRQQTPPHTHPTKQQHRGARWGEQNGCTLRPLELTRKRSGSVGRALGLVPGLGGCIHERGLEREPPHALWRSNFPCSYPSPSPPPSFPPAPCPSRSLCV